MLEVCMQSPLARTHAKANAVGDVGESVPRLTAPRTTEMLRRSIQLDGHIAAHYQGTHELFRTV
ncbi:hypothetical protein PMI02_01012 [Novosphingobium sp. AP12]|nr:hypothetical protein PMI02_01012 [Novosphingobium sp. AP12]